MSVIVCVSTRGLVNSVGSSSSGGGHLFGRSKSYYLRGLAEAVPWASMTSCLASRPGQRAAKTINCIGCCAPLFIFPQINFTQTTRNLPGEALRLPVECWWGQTKQKRHHDWEQMCENRAFKHVTRKHTHFCLCCMAVFAARKRQTEHFPTQLSFYFLFFQRMTSQSDWTFVPWKQITLSFHHQEKKKKHKETKKQEVGRRAEGGRKKLR